MAEIISFVERRGAKLRDRLMTVALRGEAVIIETRKGLIRADRMICRDVTVEIVTSWGENFIVSYSEIRDIRAGVSPQVSTISDHGDFVVPTDAFVRTGTSQVLAFARPGRRR
jgi:hypothetical protein